MKTPKPTLKVVEPQPAPEPSCERCRFWLAPKVPKTTGGWQPSGLCRRYPEAVAVNNSGWCGEFHGRT